MTNLSIKNVPDEVLARLKAQAKHHHRSLQGELIAIIEEAVKPKTLTVEEVHRLVLSKGLRTGSESVDMVRQDRDAR